MSRKVTKPQSHKIFFVLNFIFLMSLCLCVLVSSNFSDAFALSLERIQSPFVKGDYKAVIKEGEKLMRDARERESNLEDLYYILGLSYLKEGNLLRAWDIFEIILNEFNSNKYTEEARLGLGDVYFLRRDYKKAEENYKKIIEDNPQTEMKAVVLYRLSQVALKEQETEKTDTYLETLRNEFPLEAKGKLAKDLLISPPITYTVQVGAFTQSENAQRLAQKLKEKNYPAYLEAGKSGGKLYYRVKVGKYQSKYEAEVVQKKLLKEGYPTKIYP